MGAEFSPDDALTIDLSVNYFNTVDDEVSTQATVGVSYAL